MFALSEALPSSKPALYETLAAQARALVETETDIVANAANFASLVYHSLDGLNWAGFYFFDGRELVVGPFQGKPACVRIPLGKGVCGTAAQTRRRAARRSCTTCTRLPATSPAIRRRNRKSSCRSSRVTAR